MVVVVSTLGTLMDRLDTVTQLVVSVACPIHTPQGLDLEVRSFPAHHGTLYLSLSFD